MAGHPHGLGGREDNESNRLTAPRTVRWDYDAMCSALPAKVQILSL